jgi:hypothetical protein
MRSRVPTVDLRLADKTPAERERIEEEIRYRRDEQDRMRRAAERRARREQFQRDKVLHLGQFQGGAFVFFQGERRQQAYENLTQAHRFLY